MHKPRTVDGILKKLKEKADIGGYLYRGEPEHYMDHPFYGKVSSNLFRVFLCDKRIDVDEERFNIEEVQNAVLNISKQFSRKSMSDLEYLSEIQHYGGKTNLIDFTKDYHIALFMACDGIPDENGRIILQARTLVEPYIEEAYDPINRVIAQKSIFVRHPDGFILPKDDDIIDIQSDLKLPMLRHLQNSHDISVETIYNDIHGFIRDQNNHSKFYNSIYEGLIQKQKGDTGNG
ncbi:hypothetical protein C6497_01965 [Candidatus Poribacteria bacterium]|nr:MAG: hypothetical protein C6497_01965 [Candidatus Poribacteria bacterium]